MAAIATPVGRGGIGIVRLSGPLSWTIAEQLTMGQPRLAGRMANLRRITCPGETEPLDEAIVLPMRGPHSYTGEDTVEFQTHGSPAVLDELLRVCCQRGARMAEPGEFTFRALMAGKLSLLQAEAVRDLVDASSAEELALARRSFFGDTAVPFRSALDAVMNATASLEASLDFPEQFSEEDEKTSMQNARTFAQQAMDLVKSLLADGENTARLYRGVTVVITGSPNVGKSSLMNALLKYPRVIVSDIPGTTRDVVTAEILVGGRRVTLVDTAGISATPMDSLDVLARDQARKAVADADIAIVVLDAVTGLLPHERLLLDTARSRPHIVAVNKVDVEPVSPGLAAEAGEPVLGISATAGTELQTLTARLAELVEAATGALSIRQLVTQRQAYELSLAREALERFVQVIDTEPADVLAELLGEAREALLRLLGERMSPNEILTTVFSTFCIGK